MKRAMRSRTLSTVIAFAIAGAGLVLGGAGYVIAQSAQKAEAVALAEAPLVPLPPQPAGVAWPTEQWAVGTPPASAQAVVKAQLDEAFASKTGPKGETRAVIIVHRGRIVAERYGQGFDASSKLISWSVAKSITAALVGVGLGDGKLKLDDPLNEPLWADSDPRRAITFRQALHMEDGLRWREDGYDDPVQNDAAKMLFGPGRENIVEYVASKRQEYPPGTRWRYSSGTTNLISAALARKVAPRNIEDPTGREGLRNFMYDRFFRPIGMMSAAAEFDLAGNFYGSSLVHATAQDWARFGYLHLRDGVWAGQRILPAGYVDFLRTPTTGEGATEYGAHWWLSPANKAGLLKDGPYDSFEAHGFQGQIIMVVPSKDLVIVRLGMSQADDSWDALGAWLQPIVQAFPSVTPG